MDSNLPFGRRIAPCTVVITEQEVKIQVKVNCDFQFDRNIAHTLMFAWMCGFSFVHIALSSFILRALENPLGSFITIQIKREPLGLIKENI